PHRDDHVAAQEPGLLRRAAGARPVETHALALEDVVRDRAEARLEAARAGRLRLVLRRHERERLAPEGPDEGEHERDDVRRTLRLEALVVVGGAVIVRVQPAEEMQRRDLALEERLVVAAADALARE